jgi:hypothetical protein
MKLTLESIGIVAVLLLTAIAPASAQDDQSSGGSHQSSSQGSSYDPATHGNSYDPNSSISGPSSSGTPAIQGPAEALPRRNKVALRT